MSEVTSTTKSTEITVGASDKSYLLGKLDELHSLMINANIDSLSAKDTRGIAGSSITVKKTKG